MSAPGFLTETRERFLKAIVAQLPVERIRELYVFQPMKQGGVESGVAVVAAWPEGAQGVERSASGENDAVADGAVGDDAAGDRQSAVGENDAVELTEVVGDAAEANACEVPTDSNAPTDADAPVADRQPPTGAEAAPDAPRPTPDAEKYTVYTARYRHVLKGPDRGKWEATVVAEADAPLVSIESVVRGVQRRAGDVDAPDHMTGDDIRASLRLGAGAAGGVA